MYCEICKKELTGGEKARATQNVNYRKLCSYLCDDCTKKRVREIHEASHSPINIIKK